MSVVSLDVEKGLISKILQDRDSSALSDLQLKPRFFNGENKNAYNFIVNSLKDTGEIPTARAFSRQFPSYQLEHITVDNKEIVGTEENLKFWSNEVRKKVKQNTLADTISETAEYLQKLDTDEAMEFLKKKLAYLDLEVAETEDVDITKNTDERKRAYLERKKHQGMIGLPTGIKHLDYLTKGLEKGTLTTCIALSGVGKAVTLNTSILTPNGFVPMGDIKVGDKVISEDGKPYKVSAVYPQGKLDVYQVVFEDNSYVNCNEEHLWKFKTRSDLASNKGWRVDTLKNLMKLPIKTKQGERNICIPVQAPVKKFKCEEKRSFIEPYVMGCLLGDGGFTTDRITFTNPEKDILGRLNKSLKEYGEFVYHKGTGCQYAFKSRNTGYNSLFREIKRLGLQGKKSFMKFIPKTFLLRDLEYRKELLRGLIDTGGCVNKKGAVSFDTNSSQLCKDVAFLVRSLGYRCSESRYDHGEKGIEYIVRVFAKTADLFSSDKHKERFDNRAKNVREHRYDVLKVVSITKLNRKEEMQCITVDSPEHTFLCSDFIVTHNTWLQVLIGANCMLQNCRVLHFVTEMSEDLMRDRYDAMLYSKCYGKLSYSQFKSGKLDKKTEDNYFRFLEEDLPSLESLTIATATGVMAVGAAIEKYAPDIVLIDSAYLMEDDQGAKDDWLRVAHITRGLKKLAKRLKIPIVINTQADKNTSKKSGPELGSIMYTQAIGQDSDLVLAQFRDEVMINDKEMGIKLLKQREGTLGKVMMNWNFDIMDFSEIYMESAEKGVETEESIEQKDNTLNIMEDKK